MGLGLRTHTYFLHDIPFSLPLALPFIHCISVPLAVYFMFHIFNINYYTINYLYSLSK
jgi:hypothetical protein